MRAVVQRSAAASVEVEGRVVGAIDRGLVAFVAVERGDGPAEAAWLARKLADLRLLSGPDGRLDRSLRDEGAGLLLVSNFTVAGRTGKGAKPDFSRAAPAAEARALFDRVVAAVRDAGLPVATGEFGADMRVCVEGDGPVTVILEREPAADGSPDR